MLRVDNPAANANTRSHPSKKELVKVLSGLRKNVEGALKIKGRV